ncbi:MAG: HD-GYP domain-containing protein [Nitrospirae bacterium]|nr:HD-GYP domain-containing protein [Nitrospirota bacterium]
MVKKVAVNKLKPGMFVHDLNCGWLDHPFFSSRFKIKSYDDIKKIAGHGIRELYIDTDKGLDVEGAMSETEVKKALQKEIEQVAASRPVPAKEAPVKEAPIKEVPINEEIKRAKEVKDEAKKLVVNILEEVRLGKHIETEKVGSVVTEMADSVFRNQDALISLSRIKLMDEYLFFHSVSVCVLMISFCRIMGVDRATINNVGVGALLHDIGKTKTPPEILNKPGKLSDNEFQIMKLHSSHSYKILLANGGIPEVGLQVAHEHHERYDGSGYPRGLRGEAISKYGQMAAIVDVYDAITSDRCYHKGLQPSDAVRKLFEWSKFHFNNELVQYFIKCVGIYPVGTLVRLDDDNLAVVTEVGRKNLTTPKVKVVYSTRQRRLIKPFEIDLAEHPNKRKIVGAEDPAEWGVNPFDYVGTGI